MIDPHEHQLSAVAATANRAPSADNALPCPDPETVTLSRRFAQAVQAFPARTALTSGGRSFTYAELGHSSAHIAARLLEADGPADRSPVGLLLDQGIDFISGIFGTLSTGRAFVPLDPTYPADRLSAMREDANLLRVVCTADHLEHARAVGFKRKQLLVIDRGEVDVNARYVAGPAVPTDPAWIMFTSGSTGRPKGVLQTHRVAVHNYGRHLTGFGLTPADRQSLVYPTSVYGGLRDILNALLTGAALCHYPLRDEGYAGLPDWLGEQRCSIYCSVASVFRRFTRCIEDGRAFKDVRLIKLGGETVHPEDLRQFQRLFGESCVLFSGLGSTETGMTLRHRIGVSDRIDTASVPLGKPVDGVEVLLLDEQRQPVEFGGVGEIAIRSRYLTEGYIGREDLNAQVFSRDAQDADIKTCYTGDLGQFGNDGLLYHRGRKDFQVKVRGNRVELNDVEAALHAVPEIHDAVVLAVTDEAGDTRLEAYVVFDVPEPRWPSASTLRDALRAGVPRFAVPGVYWALEAMPLTPNGKLDRKALPACATKRLGATRDIHPPVGDTEVWIARLFSDTLGETVDDANAGFFDLGGDSLKAVDLLLRIDKAFGREVALGELLRCPSVRALAAMLSDAGVGSTHPILVPLRTDGDLPPLFVLSGRGGSVTCYAKLLPYLPDDQPVFGLQLPGVAPGTEPIDDAVALATQLKETIIQAAGEGPVRLLGYSFGGLLVFEIARQLEADGKRPQWVGIIDHHAPGSRQKLAMPRRLALRAQLLAEQGWSGRKQWMSDRVKRLIGRSTDKPDLVPPGQEALLERLRRVNEASVRAGRSYAYGRYVGSVEVFACRQRHDFELFYRQAEDRGWTTFANVRKVRRIDGRHLEVFEPSNVPSLGDAISAALRSIAGEIATRRGPTNRQAA